MQSLEFFVLRSLDYDSSNSEIILQHGKTKEDQEIRCREKIDFRKRLTHVSRI